jgi:cardiolipin synthase
VLPSAGASVIDYQAGNRLRLLKNGEQFFPALVSAIDGAQQEVFLETYIFADDETASLVTNALARAAARGVPTRLLVDGFGTPSFPQRLREILSGAGVELLIFRPSLLPWFLRRPRAPLRRMHRKLASIDGRLAFVGGINIIDDTETPEPAPPRYDYAVQLEGPIAARVRAEAASLWSRVAWASIGRRWPGFNALRASAPRARQGAGVSQAGTQRAALVVRDNLRRRHSIESAYLELIESAREEILIANAYFFPTRRFRRALVQAVKRKVQVTLLLQGRVEYLLQHYASRAHYRTLLAAGVRIHEYHTSFLHAKVAVFDGRTATVGSSNIDPFSLLLAQEANVFVDDAGFAGELRDSLLEATRIGGRKVAVRYWQRLSWSLKARIWLCYRVARLLMAMFGFDRLR